MEYQEYAPPIDLRATIHCFWTLEGRAADLREDLQPVLPDGRPELVVHLGDPFDRIDERGEARRQAPILFAGQLTTRLVLRARGRIAVSGVRFRADGAASLLPIPQAQLAGLTAPLEDLSGALHARLAEVRAETDAPRRAIQLLEDRLRPWLRARGPDRRVGRAVDLIADTRGMVGVDTLAREAGMTRRHLERRFHSVVGISPKRLARITRFQHARAILERSGVPARGTRTAAECGYADQAHFIREFRELAGCAPGAHLLGQAELTGFFARTHSRPGLDR